jgi:hypothetical protein
VLRVLLLLLMLLLLGSFPSLVTAVRFGSVGGHGEGTADPLRLGRA